MFAICRRPSVCLCLSSVVCLSSVTFVHPTQAIEIFGNVSTPFGTLAIYDFGKNFTEFVPGEPLRRGVKPKRGRKMYRFWTFARLYLGNGAR